MHFSATDYTASRLPVLDDRAHAQSMVMSFGGARSLYEVRRVVRPGKGGKSGITARSLRVLATGNCEAVSDLRSSQPGVPARGGDGILRYLPRDRDRRRGGVDHLFGAAPAGAESKQRSGFEQWRQEATGDGLF